MAAYSLQKIGALLSCIGRAIFFHADFKVYRLLSISVDELTKKSKTTAVTMGLLSILRKLKSSPDRELRILLLGK